MGGGHQVDSGQGPQGIQAKGHRRLCGVRGFQAGVGTTEVRVCVCACVCVVVGVCVGCMFHMGPCGVWGHTGSRLGPRGSCKLQVGSRDHMKSRSESIGHPGEVLEPRVDPGGRSEVNNTTEICSHCLGSKGNRSEFAVDVQFENEDVNTKTQGAHGP